VNADTLIDGTPVRIPRQRTVHDGFPDMRSGRPSRPSGLARHHARRSAVATVQIPADMLDTRVLAVTAAGYVIADSVFGGPLSFVTGWAGIAFFGGLLALASLAEALLLG
jgi:hypothetical protein